MTWEAFTWVGDHPKEFWQAADQHLTLSTVALGAALRQHRHKRLAQKRSLRIEPVRFRDRAPEDGEGWRHATMTAPRRPANSIGRQSRFELSE
jgi:hypothetical protein